MKFSLPCTLKITTTEALKKISYDFLFDLGKRNPMNIKMITANKIVSTQVGYYEYKRSFNSAQRMQPLFIPGKKYEMKYFDYVKIGIQNVRAIAGKTKVTKNMVRNMFIIKGCLDNEKRVYFYAKKTPSTYKKLKPYVGEYECTLLENVNTILNTHASRAIAPAHTYACQMEIDINRFQIKSINMCINEIKEIMSSDE